MRVCFIACVVLFLLLSWPASAQQQQKGALVNGDNAVGNATPFGSFAGSEIDNVNLYNGSLTVRIPVAVLPGRNGMSLDLAIPYSSLIWNHTTAAGISPMVAPNDLHLPSGHPPRTVVYTDPYTISGWRLVPNFLFKTTIDALLLAVTLDPACVGIPETARRGVDCELKTYAYDIRHLLTDPSGSRHEFRNVETDGWVCEHLVGAQRGQPPGGPCAAETRPRARYRSVDSSHMEYHTQRGIITMKEGTQLFAGRFAESLPPADALGPERQFEPPVEIFSGEVARDSNGNLLKGYYTEDLVVPGLGQYQRRAVFQDTLGRAITMTVYYRGDPPLYQDRIERAEIRVPSDGAPQVYSIEFVRLHFNDHVVFGPPSGEGTRCSRTFLHPLPPEPLDMDFYAISKITLPNGLYYGFEYGPVHESHRDEHGPVSAGWLTKIIYPTGGYTRYEYVCPGFVNLAGHANWRIKSRHVCPGSDCAPGSELTWRYDSLRTDARIPPGQVRVTDPAGNVTVHTFIDGLYSPFKGMERSVEWYEPDPGDPARLRFLKREENVYVAEPPVGTAAPLYHNPRLASRTTTLDTGLQTKVEYEYDRQGYDQSPLVRHTNGNVTQVREYHYRAGGGAPWALARTTERQYLTGGPYGLDGRHILDRVTSEVVREASGAMAARTEFEYDQYGPDSDGHARLLARSATAHHDAVNFGPDQTARGNVTTVRRFSDAAGRRGESKTAHHYDVCGNVVRTKDMNGNATSFDYTAATQFAYPETITNALNQTVARRYSLATGLLQSETDANGQTTSHRYDMMRRIQETRPPDGGQIRYYYSDAAEDLSGTCGGDRVFDPATVWPLRKGICTTSTTGPPVVESLALIQFDGLGRVTQTLTKDPEGDVRADTEYDELGRVARVSNPYRSEERQWTTTRYDGLSRMQSVTTPDGETASRAYSGNQTTVVDQAGRSRRTEQDALGHLSKVWEAPTDADFNLLTTYTYNAVGDLTEVSQGVQQRRFVYDGLSHLIRASHPESGTIEYEYDGNGNRIRKSFTKDGQAVTVRYRYDALDRLTEKTYSDDTPAATYQYDEPIPNGRGQRTRAESGGIVWEALAYDATGRLTQERRRIADVEFKTEYRYDLAGQLVGLRYPSGKEARFVRNRAQHLIAAEDERGAVYAKDLRYHPHGGLRSITYGNGLTQTITYNERQQPTRFSIPEHMEFEYEYTARGNNGNIYSVRDLAREPAVRYDFSYDPLNRLRAARITGQPDQAYYYDRYGNLRKNDPQVEEYVDARTNRIRLRGYAYDEAGHLTRTPEHGYRYDAEHRLISVDAGATARYAYDADGRRALKVADGRRTLYLYDAAGALLSEFEGPDAGRLEATAPPAPAVTTVKYYHNDPLGTPRVVTNTGGAVLERRDFFPFGEEITATPDDALKFTGKLRDAESGLDYFGLRYCSSALGRFMSPDTVAHPSQSSVGFENFLAEPQRWNMYAYALNNPLKYIDPDGAEAAVISLGDNQYYAGGQIITVPRRSFKEQLLIAAAPALALAAAIFAPEAASGLLYLAARNPGAVIAATALAEGLAPGPPRIPLGFKSAEQFQSAAQEIKTALGVEDAVVGIRGSSVTGVRFKTGEAVTAGTVKDFDFFAISDKLVGQLGGQKALGKGFIHLTKELLKSSPELKKVLQQIEKETGKRASVRIFTEKYFKEAVKKEETILVNR